MDSRQHSCSSMKLVKAAQLNQPIPIIDIKLRKKCHLQNLISKLFFLNNIVFEEIMTKK